MRLSYPGTNPEISEWKGQEITDFQEELLKKVNGRISEKWFYTHIKSASESIPRIDVLNMLSQYAGYINWNDFRMKNSDQVSLTQKLKNETGIFIMIPVIFLATMVLLFILYRIVNTQNYRFTFIDADTGEPVISSNIRADVILKDESPVSYTSDKEGSIIIRTDQSRIKLAINAPYYLPDTIIRTLKKFHRAEQIKLNVDSYALIIRYFSQTDLKGWQQRREQLEKIIDENAMIYQVPDQKEGSGMELYNKSEFIDKLTMPSSSLRQIEILNTRYHDGQIAILRFKINVNKK